MKIEKFGVYLADLNPQIGTEPGKVRPVVVIQTDMLNATHMSTIVFPVTTKVAKGAKVLRVHLDLSPAGLKRASDILVDQIRSIDNKRLIKQTGVLSGKNRRDLLTNMQLVLFE